MFEYLTAQQIMYAAILALVITWFVLRISKFFRIAVSSPTSFLYRPEDLNKIIQKCYNLFPRDMIMFHGETFKRGMKVRMITSQQKVFEGQLLGSNKENVVCVLTSRFVIAHDMGNLDRIEKIDDIA